MGLILKYHFLVKRKGKDYFAEGIDIKFNYQAETKSELYDTIQIKVQNYLKKNFNGNYDPEIFYDWEPEQGETTLLEVKIPIDFAFALILREIRKTYPGGKKNIMRTLGIKSEYIYDGMENYNIHCLKDLESVYRCLNFPIEWLFK